MAAIERSCKKAWLLATIEGFSVTAGAVKLLKSFDILKEGYDIFDISAFIEYRSAGYDAHSCIALRIMEPFVVLKTADALFLLHDQIKNADIQYAEKIMYVHF